MAVLKEFEWISLDSITTHVDAIYMWIDPGSVIVEFQVKHRKYREVIFSI